MRKLLYIVAVAVCAACAAEIDAPISEIDGMSPPPVDQEDAEDLGRPDVYYADQDDQDDACYQLPDDGSACAHACDQAALESFIPAGTCATFECPLADGTVMRVGGCNAGN